MFGPVARIRRLPSGVLGFLFWVDLREGFRMKAGMESEDA